ncbi:hypothetical protein CW304_25025 [Bacillus sp. UFRGS-B20]|nr:hypothetical protein CW304_25025 [Bacillus sp. UFRGS-B20]
MTYTKRKRANKFARFFSCIPHLNWLFNCLQSSDLAGACRFVILFCFAYSIHITFGALSSWELRNLNNV